MADGAAFVAGDAVAVIDDLRRFIADGKGGKLALARALAALEERPQDPDIIALLDAAFAAPQAHVVGLTGPPGVGKSTLVNALVADWRAEGASVGVLAVDPSSRASGGALLGDRTRMRVAPDDDHVFFRSLASRGQLGGLSDLTFPSMVLMRALFDYVLVESVGVGQSEAEIVGVADTVVLCIQPGSGDSLQFMKAGIMEIPDVAVVTKADMGVAARRALSDVKGALSLAAGQAWDVPVVAVSATEQTGLEDLRGAIASHFAWLQARERLDGQRAEQAIQWARDAIVRDYGAFGLAALVDAGVDFGAGTPFETRQRAAQRIELRAKT